MSRRPRPAGRGVLVLLSLLFISSGLIRLGGGSHAFATTSSDEPVAAPAAQSCEGPRDELGLLAELRTREERVIAREAELNDRDRALALARTEIDRKLAELEAAETSLSETLTMADKAADEDVARLVSVYERMKPKDAAALFTEMDPDFAAGFLARMRPELAASVMAGLAPDKAYTISVVLAGRNANAPKY